MNFEIKTLIADERPRLLQYACYRLGNMQDAEDAVQDVLANLHQQLSSGAAVHDPTAYLFRSLANRCTSRQREAARLQTVPLLTTTPMATTDSDDEDFEQEYHRISQLLSQIPDEQAEIIRLRFYGDKSFREIAQILNLPLTTAKSRFVYGIEKIRKGLTACGLMKR